MDDLQLGISDDEQEKNEKEDENSGIVMQQQVCTMRVTQVLHTLYTKYP